MAPEGSSTTRSSRKAHAMASSISSSVTVIASRGFSSMLTTAGADCSGESCIDGRVTKPCMQTIGGCPSEPPG